MEVLIIGAGIGGLTLGLMLHRAGIACRIFEAAPELKAVGVGINILPHASRELCALGLEDALAKVAVTTREYCFYNRFGQYIYSEPAGKFAGYDVPQFSIHRGDLQMVLLDAFIERAGADKVITGWRCIRVEHDGPVLALVNPVLEWSSRDEDVMEEGCLSLPGVHVDVERPTHVRVRAQALALQHQELLSGAEALDAHVGRGDPVVARVEEVRESLLVGHAVAERDRVADHDHARRAALATRRQLPPAVAEAIEGDASIPHRGDGAGPSDPAVLGREDVDAARLDEVRGRQPAHQELGRYNDQSDEAAARRREEQFAEQVAHAAGPFSADGERRGDHFPVYRMNERSPQQS